MPQVEAPIYLSSTVRPWAYLWSDADSVMLEARRPQLHSAARVSPPKARLPLGKREARLPKPPSLPLPPLRARTIDGATPLYPLGARPHRHTRTARVPVRGVPSAVEGTSIHPRTARAACPLRACCRGGRLASQAAGQRLHAHGGGGGGGVRVPPQGLPRQATDGGGRAGP